MLNGVVFSSPIYKKKAGNYCLENIYEALRKGYEDASNLLNLPLNSSTFMELTFGL
jgi:hypothetical protein